LKARAIGGWLARIGVSAVLLLWLWHKPKVHDALLGLPPHTGRWLAAAVALYLGCQLVNTLKWQVLLRTLGYSLPYGRLLMVTFIGMFCNLFLPTAVGGDLARVGLMKVEKVPLEIGTLSVFVQRLTGFVALLVIGLCGLLVSGKLADPVPRGVLVGLGGLLAALLAGMAVGLWLERRLDLAKRLPPKLGAALARLGAGARALLADPRGLLWVMVLSFVFQLWQVGIGLWLAGPARCTVAARQYLWLVPTFSVAGMVPVGLGGIGVKEHVANSLLRPLLGDAGVVWQVLWDCMVLLSSLPGALLSAGVGARTRKAIAEDSVP
jgi:uncharacterized protein (TIRG00374 family)